VAAKMNVDEKTNPNGEGEEGQESMDGGGMYRFRKRVKIRNNGL